MEERYEDAIVVDAKEEAEFIQQWLMENHGIAVSIENIMLITDGQIAYMEKIGLIEEFKG